MGGAVFGGRRAIILKSHGFDLLQERKQRDIGEVADMCHLPLGLGPCCFSTLAAT